MTHIRQEDLTDSVAAALQYISFYHPADYIAHLARAYAIEQSPAAKDAIAQILTNSKMSATGHRPMCQDTGIVNVFLKVGMDVRWECFTGSLDDAVNEGVRRAYNHPDNPLRASVVADPQFARKNTNDNTPAVIFTEIVPGNTVDVGLPDEKLIRRACNRARHVMVLSYGGRTAEIWWQQTQGKVSGQKNLRVLSLSVEESKALASLAARGMRLQCTIQDGVIWLGGDQEHVELAPKVLFDSDLA